MNKYEWKKCNFIEIKEQQPGTLYWDGYAYHLPTLDLDTAINVFGSFGYSFNPFDNNVTWNRAFVTAQNFSEKEINNSLFIAAICTDPAPVIRINQNVRCIKFIQDVHGFSHWLIEDTLRNSTYVYIFNLKDVQLPKVQKHDDRMDSLIRFACFMKDTENKDAVKEIKKILNSAFGAGEYKDNDPLYAPEFETFTIEEYLTQLRICSSLEEADMVSMIKLHSDALMYLRANPLKSDGIKSEILSALQEAAKRDLK